MIKISFAELITRWPHKWDKIVYDKRNRGFRLWKTGKDMTVIYISEHDEQREYKYKEWSTNIKARFSSRFTEDVKITISFYK